MPKGPHPTFAYAKATFSRFAGEECAPALCRRNVTTFRHCLTLDTGVRAHFSVAFAPANVFPKLAPLHREAAAKISSAKAPAGTI
jgi:hypothetical protein